MTMHVKPGQRNKLNRFNANNGQLELFIVFLLAFVVVKRISLQAGGWTGGRTGPLFIDDVAFEFNKEQATSTTSQSASSK